ncbi:hypothetical protein K440DRAFT_659976 [Wilcoxina mikolae CBS 423.85]|nr:hypothetical protein K440DRAFT_659976 [Wilcoxina mikolae CBS 423.85]
MDSRDYMPETYNMPSTFNVQALTEKYIRAHVLEDYLISKFGTPYQDWLKIVRPRTWWRRRHNYGIDKAWTPYYCGSGGVDRRRNHFASREIESTQTTEGLVIDGLNPPNHLKSLSYLFDANDISADFEKESERLFVSDNDVNIKIMELHGEVVCEIDRRKSSPGIKRP